MRLIFRPLLVVIVLWGVILIRYLRPLSANPLERTSKLVAIFFLLWFFSRLASSVVDRCAIYTQVDTIDASQLDTFSTRLGTLKNNSVTFW